MSPENPGHPEVPPNPSGMYTQEVRHAHVTARVPEKIGRGLFSNGALVAHGAHEFLIDFVLRVTQPHQIVGRVVVPPSVMGPFIAALQDNLYQYQAKFGSPPALPASPSGLPAPPSIEEIYAQLKLPDEILSGVYANAVIITHTFSEFCFDFVTNFYPRSAVSCRVFLSVFQVPGFLESLIRSYQQYQQKLAGGQHPKPPSPPAPPPPTA